jgi:hypothetical protein
MPDGRKIRGQVNVVLNGLIRDGVISAFRTNFGRDNEPGAPIITVTTPEGGSPDDVKAHVMDALADVVIGVSLIIEPK